MKISKIEIQKTNPDRVNIYCDNKFYCGIDVEVYYSLKLSKGSEITDEIKAEIDKQNALSKCYRKAVSLLNYRDRTSFELRKKLKEKLFDEKEINWAITKLENEGYVNDNNFLETYITYYKDSLSKLKITQKLWQMGIPLDLIRDKLNQYFNDETDEYKACLLVMEAKIRYTKMEREKLFRHLLYKGFTYNTVTKVLNDHFPKDDGG